jgi:hypothetical protein
MTNPNRDFEAWGESLGPDIEAYVRELARLPGYIVIYAQPIEWPIPSIYVDKAESYTVKVGHGLPVEYRVGYLEDRTSEAS